MKSHWRLPRGVDELLPPDAWGLELLRRQVLDLFVSWGFEYVELPIIEYLDALLVGSGEDLDLQTLKVVDQVSGRQLGVRADMTSQAVRVDAHSRLFPGVQRLCYAGPVVFANPQLAQSSRVPIKAGAEIFGAASLDADAEVIKLMMQTVQAAGIEQPVLLVGHMGIYRSLVAELKQAGDLDPSDEADLFRCVQRKSESDIRALLSDSKLSQIMAALPQQMMPVTLSNPGLEPVKAALAGAPAGVSAALAQLEALLSLVLEEGVCEELRVDISELSGYGYHNGPVFAVYHPTAGSALAQGGRYDNVGEAFGRARPATGFDVILQNLVSSGVVQAGAQTPIFAPLAEGEQREALQECIRELRQQGEIVWCALSADEQAAEHMRKLEWIDGNWQVA